MTKEDFAILVKGLKAVYTDPRFIPDKNAFDVWYGLMGHLSYEAASAATQKHMATNTTAPTPAHILKIAGEITGPVQNTMTAGEAFNLYWKAAQNGTYHSEEEFEKLPPLVQEAVGGAAALREIAMRDDINYDVERSLFERRFAAVQQRAQHNEQISPVVRDLIGQITASREDWRNMLPQGEKREAITMNRAEPPADLMDRVRRSMYE